MKHSYIINHGAQTARNYETREDKIFDESSVQETNSKAIDLYSLCNYRGAIITKACE